MTLAFDVYGTLIDPNAVFQKLTERIPEKAQAVMDLWRAKQLEYTFRRGLMGKYVDFAVCTRQALRFSCQTFEVNLSDADIEAVLAQYKTLPAYTDVHKGLQALRDKDIQLVAFSNGSKDDVSAVLQQAKILDFFAQVISVEAVKSFKPNPTVYEHLVTSTHADKAKTYLISGNSFDVLGAKAAGLKAIWLQRSDKQIMDFWEWTPDHVVHQVDEIGQLF
ncbi:MAG: haloacid dehalogenase type II [Flavobacteriaceae bacterium]|nr:haloacid dehalogenase type II [Flavobacteriaceae bacterium]